MHVGVIWRCCPLSTAVSLTKPNYNHLHWNIRHASWSMYRPYAIPNVKWTVDRSPDTTPPFWVARKTAVYGV